MVREGLRVLLAGEADIRVLGAARDGAECLELARQLRPDLVLMDLKMRGMNGVQATRAIRTQCPAVRVLVLTTYDADELVIDAIRGGAAGYLLKDTPREQLLAAIRDTMAGKTHVDPAVAGKLFASVAQTVPRRTSVLCAELSEREREVLALLGRGLSNADIAAQLHLSEGTVRNYVSAVLAKLGVTDRTKAAVLAIQHGLVDLRD
jgi:NarL family two-component system response regulator LiaR